MRSSGAPGSLFCPERPRRDVPPWPPPAAGGPPPRRRRRAVGALGSCLRLLLPLALALALLACGAASADGGPRTGAGEAGPDGGAAGPRLADEAAAAGRARPGDFAAGVAGLLSRGLRSAGWGAGVEAAPAPAPLGRSLLEHPKALPDYSYYHPADKLLAAAEAIAAAHPDTMTVTKLHRAAADAATYTTHLLLISVEPAGRGKAARGVSGDQLRVFVDFGQHGRELVTSEIALGLLRLLATGPPAAIAAAALGPGAAAAALADLTAALRAAVFLIAPMENVNGRRLVEAGALCERKNGRGVDPNRNWGIHWGHKEKDYDPAEEFPGSGPFSEPETGLIRGAVADFKPHAWVNVHSGMEAMFLPYDHVAKPATGPGGAAMASVLASLNAAHCGGRCAVGSGGAYVGYLAHGTATDYMYDVLKVPLSFTWEVYGQPNAPGVHPDDCFRMFNPVTPEELASVVAAWAPAFVHLLQLMLEHPDVPRVEGMAGAAGRPAREGGGGAGGAAGGGGKGGAAEEAGSHAGALAAAAARGGRLGRDIWGGSAGRGLILAGLGVSLVAAGVCRGPLLRRWRAGRARVRFTKEWV